MALRNREYLLSIDGYNKPWVVEDKEAIGLNLVRLLLLNPGGDPLRPEMGVGLRDYRYALTLDELTQRIDDQIKTYLPHYQNVDVQIIRTPDKVANIEITMNDITFVYDSRTMPVPIDLEYIRTN